MKGKKVLITGATSGIGFETAKAIAAEGAEVFIVGRSEAKAKDAVKQIAEVTGNKNVHYFLADFSSQKSIRNLAEQVHRETDRLEVLINNAGGVFPDFKLGEDGLEMTIATNHFAYFLLTNLVLDLVKKSEAARIVNVASGSHYRGKIDFESFTREKNYFIMKAYAQSKLANVLFTQELAEHLKDTHITVNCLHPGFVKTHIGNKGTSWYADWVWTLGTLLGGISVADGAKTSVYLATSEEVKEVSGKYFDKCREKTPAPLTNDQTLQKELWRVSEKLCPIN